MNLICKGKQINLIAKNNCLDVINWPNHQRVIKVIKFTKAKFQWNSQAGFKLQKNNTIPNEINSGFKLLPNGPRVLHPFSAKGNISSEKIFEKLWLQTKNLMPYLYLIDKKHLISRIFSAAKLRFIDYANYIDG